MPLDRRALRSQLQRSRGFEPFARRTKAGKLYAAGSLAAAKLCLMWLSGQEMTVTAAAFETVAQVKRRVQKMLAESSGCRYQLLSPTDGLLSDDATMCSLGLAGCTSTLQLIADRSLTWHRGIRGNNAEISEDGQTAKRVNSFYEAIVFCAVPSRSCRIRIVEMENCWSGSLELGFAALPPEELGFKRGTGNISSVAMSIGTSTSEPWHVHLRVGSIVQWQLLQDGSIKVTVEGKRDHWTSSPQQPRFKRKVQKAQEVYPFAGIYGMTQAIELLGLDDE